MWRRSTSSVVVVVDQERARIMISSSMFSSWLVLAPISLLLLANKVHASALTTAIAPNERLCFYADVDKAGEKIGVTCPTTLSTCPVS